MIDLSQHRYYNNRELTWIDYDDRVLSEVSNPANPLLERLRLLGIAQNNLDGFVRVRVAKIVKRAQKWPTWRDAMGLTYGKQLDMMIKKMHRLVRAQYRVLNQEMVPQLHVHHINLLHMPDLNVVQHDYANRYFERQLFPSITPIAIDASHPFPFVSDGTIGMAVLIRKPHDPNRSFAMIPIARNFPRLIRVPSKYGNDFVLQEDLIKDYLSQVFQGLIVKDSICFRLTRDQDIAINDRHTANLMHEVRHRLKRMKYGRPLRLEIEHDANPVIRSFLQKQFGLKDRDVYRVAGPVDLHFCGEIVKNVKGHSRLRSQKYVPFFPPVLRKESFFKAIRQHDWFFHRPYDSFRPVLIFLREAATDPQVIGIKITLYRVSKHSPVIRALCRAAENGKLVTVLIELKARGDEDLNSRCARLLQSAGCQVIYGMLGLKVHCKLAMVIRKEKSGTRRYLHMSTGNYNEKTAKHYVDMDLFTDNPVIGDDATDIFNMLSGFSKPKRLHQLVISPFGIRKFLIRRMNREVRAARAGQPAAIYIKVNHLSDVPIMREIYRASYAGVKVHIIVRTICDLRLNDPRVAKNITVHSLGFGRFLEHSRIYMFKNHGHPLVYLSSADLMPRNLSRRVELLFPILDARIRRQIIGIYRLMWRDNVQTMVLQPDDTWRRVKVTPHEPRLSYQEYCVKHRQQIAGRLYNGKKW